MDSEILTTGGGLPGSSSILGGKFRLDPAADATGLGGGGGSAPAEPAEGALGESVRPQVDLSGLTADQLSEVPDLHGGEEPSSTTGQAPTPADPNLAASMQRTQTPPAQAAPTIRDVARGYGFDLSQYQDDGAAFYALVQAAQRGQQDDFYARLGRQVAPHSQQIQTYLAQQQAQRPAEPARPAYMPPEFDEKWLNLVDRDEQTGTWKAKPGIDPAYAEKVQGYADWMAGFQKNPTQFIEPLVEDRARKIAAEVVRETLAGQQREQTVASIVESNSEWLYQADDQGRRYVDGSGKFIPTPAGTMYMQEIARLGKAGIRDPRTLDEVARQLVGAAIGAAQTPAATPPPAQVRAATVRPNVNGGQAVEPERRAVTPAATAPSLEGLSLSERLRRAMQEEGVTDADVYSSAGSMFGG